MGLYSYAFIHEHMKTISISDEVYEELVKLKREGESFSDVIKRLIAKERLDIRAFFGAIGDSEFLDYLEKFVEEYRKTAIPREIR